MSKTSKQEVNFYNKIADELLKLGFEKVAPMPEHNVMDIWDGRGMMEITLMSDAVLDNGDSYLIATSGCYLGDEDVEISSSSLKSDVKILAYRLRNGPYDVKE